MKDAINHVGDKFDLPNGWLNADFMHTGSYSPKLDEFSVYYKSFYGVLSVRVVEAEYLIAMKLRFGRKYKNDLSDVIGILAEHEKKGTPITFEKIDAAVENLYGGWDSFPEDSKPFICMVNTLQKPGHLRSCVLKLKSLDIYLILWYNKRQSFMKLKGKEK